MHDPGASRRGNAEARLVVIASEAQQSMDSCRDVEEWIASIRSQ
jgi:hypothetical protein